MKLCGEPGKGGCDFSNFFREGRCVSVFSLWVFQALGVEESAGRGGVGWKLLDLAWPVTDAGRTFCRTWHVRMRERLAIRI